MLAGKERRTGCDGGQDDDQRYADENEDGAYHGGFWRFLFCHGDLLRGNVITAYHKYTAWTSLFCRRKKLCEGCVTVHPSFFVCFYVCENMFVNCKQQHERATRTQNILIQQEEIVRHEQKHENGD